MKDFLLLEVYFFSLYNKEINNIVNYVFEFTIFDHKIVVATHELEPGSYTMTVINKNLIPTYRINM